MNGKSGTPKPQNEKRVNKQSRLNAHFAITLTLFCVWIFVHFGIAYWYPLLIGIIGIIGTNFTIWIDWSKTSQQQGNTKVWIRKTIDALITPWVVWTTTTLLILVATFVTTVRVDASGLDASVDVAIYPEGDRASDSSRCVPDKPPTVVFVCTHPFGRALTVKPTGFSGRPYRVYPIIYREISIKDEFQPQINLLLRLMEAPNLLADGTFVITFRGHPSDCLKVEKPFNAVMLGMNPAIPVKGKREWTTILDKQGIEDSLHSVIFKGWETPHFKQRATLKSGDTIDVLFRWRNRTYTSGTRTIILNNDKFQDYLIE
jgi:hypothetical protein